MPPDEVDETVVSGRTQPPRTPADDLEDTVISPRRRATADRVPEDASPGADGSGGPRGGSRRVSVLPIDLDRTAASGRRATERARASESVGDTEQARRLGAASDETVVSRRAAPGPRRSAGVPEPEQRASAAGQPAADPAGPGGRPETGRTASAGAPEKAIYRPRAADPVRVDRSPEPSRRETASRPQPATRASRSRLRVRTVTAVMLAAGAAVTAALVAIAVALAQAIAAAP